MKLNSKNKKILIISICILIAIILLLSTIFSLLNINSTRITSGIKINQIDVSKLYKEEAKQKISEIIEEKIDKDINITAKDFEYQIKLSQIEVNYDIDTAIEEAYGIGRNSNIFKNNFKIIESKLFGCNINLNYTYNEESLNKLLDDIASKVPNPVIEPNYYIEGEKLIVSKGSKGNSIDKDKLKEEIVNRILTDNEEDINIELIQKEPDPIDMDKIHGEVYTEAKDAYYTKDPFQVFPHVEGIDFDVEAAKKMLKEDKEEYEIQLKITQPKVTTNQIGTEAFPNLLSSFSTRYDASNIPRTTNLKLAMAKLDGVIVSPGETFSYNKTLGKRTVEDGYKEAGGYAGGRVVQTLAGGICQISSTLYDAVVYANLDIVERHNHMFLAGYVGAGKDATVVYGSLDFKFKNTRKYPIMIKTSIGSGVAKISIYGIKEEVEYDVEISTKILSYSSFRVIYEKDNSLVAGTQRVTQNGMNGCKSITYKILRLNGVEVSREVLSSDTYDPMNKIIKTGPEKASSSNNSGTSKPNTKPNAGTTTETKPSSKPNTQTTTESKPNTKPNTGTSSGTKPSTEQKPTTTPEPSVSTGTTPEKGQDEDTETGVSTDNKTNE